MHHHRASSVQLLLPSSLLLSVGQITPLSQPKSSVCITSQQQAWTKTFFLTLH